MLETIPFDRVNISVISLHFAHDEDDRLDYRPQVNRFLTRKGYALVRRMRHNYFYQKQAPKRRVAKPAGLIVSRTTSSLALHHLPQE